MSEETLAETIAILRDAGAIEVDVREAGGAWVVGAAFPFGADYPHGKPYWGHTGRMKTDGVPHWESPQEMARHHVEHYRSDLDLARRGKSRLPAGDGNEAHGEAGEARLAASTYDASLRSDETVERLDGGARSEPPADVDAPVSSLAGGLSISETLDVPQSQAQDEARAADADPLDSGDGMAANDAAESVGDADAGTAIRRGTVFDEPGQDEPGDCDLPHAYDADFEEVAAVEGADLDDPLALEFTEEMAEAEGTQSGVVYFGDDFPTMKLKKIGRLTQLALEKTRAILAAVHYDEAEYSTLQNTVMRETVDGVFRGVQPDYDRFVELSDARSHANTIDHHRDESVSYLNAADTPRLMVEQFDPEVGWPV